MIIEDEIESAFFESSFDFISKKYLAEILGLPVSTISNWQIRHWKRGEHYAVIGRTTMLRKSKVIEWLDTEFKLKDLTDDMRLIGKRKYGQQFTES
tara:strand:- start:794 stop:1081 length:288 start_codon:yes stop_codon:yes gene_type:complete